MAPVRSIRLAGVGAALLAAACGGGGGGGGMGPCTPGAATQLVKTTGDPGSWYFNNPLPAALSVTARDASGCPVPGVAVNWAVASGGGGISPAQSTTNASGVAITSDSLGSTSPTTAAVTVSNNFFSPDAVVMQTGGTVTWTWNSAGVTHDVVYDGGPQPLPTGSAPQSTGSHSNTITTVGRYTYHCEFHAGMSGSVRVVH